MSCSMRGCTNARRMRPEGISFYTFPRGDLFKSWLLACGKDEHNWTWTKNKVICSQHFRPDDMMVRGNRQYVKPNAVPIWEAGASKSVSTTVGCISETSPSAERISMSLTESYEPCSPKNKLSLKRKSTEQRTDTSGTDSDSSETKKWKIEQIKSLHNYNIPPRKLKKETVNLAVHIEDKEEKYRRKLYEAKRKITLLNKKVSALKTVVTDLQKKKIFFQ